MNGEKLGEQNYKDGKLHGKQRSWFDSSSGDRWMSDEVTYNNGKEVEGSRRTTCTVVAKRGLDWRMLLPVPYFTASSTCEHAREGLRASAI